MHIELTDHLRCTADHPEQYLVLLPQESEGRSVIEGVLGCPICERLVSVQDGIVDFGDAPIAPEEAPGLDGEALAALTGLSGPGGFLALVGPVGGACPSIAEALPGIQLVVINGPQGIPAGPWVSVIRSGTLPLKEHSMRGVVVNGPLAADAAWMHAIARTVLPGLRVVGHGGVGPPEGLDLMASAGDWWVATRTAR